MKEKQQEEGTLLHTIPIICKERLDYIGRMEEENKVNLCFKDESLGRTFEYQLKERVVIGRTEGACDIVIDYDTTISSRHCSLVLRDGNIYVKDLGSTNKTYINGKLLQEESILASQDELTMGRVKLKLFYNLNH